MDVKLVERAEAPPVATIDGVAATLNRLQLDATARRAPATPSSRRGRVGDAAATPSARLDERREQGRPVRVGRPQRRVEGRPPLVPVLAFRREVRHRCVRERRAPRLLLVEGIQTLGSTRLRRRREGLAMQHVLPPPVLRALVAAPSQIDLVGLPIGRVLLAVLAGAEPVSNDGVTRREVSLMIMKRASRRCGIATTPSTRT